jgi:imidazolonepropionase-like amidohydrolase
MPPLEAIRSATQVSARSLGIDADRGTLEAGKRADLLILTADPLRDVKNVRRIAAVYRNGKATDSGPP